MKKLFSIEYDEQTLEIDISTEKYRDLTDFFKQKNNLIDPEQTIKEILDKVEMCLLGPSGITLKLLKETYGSFKGSR